MNRYLKASSRESLTSFHYRQLRSFLLSTVPSGGDIPETVQDGVQEWKASEDLEGKLWNRTRVVAGR